jgi:hypothetical protein
MTPTTPQINNEDLIACVELLFELFRRDPPKANLADNTMQPYQPWRGVDQESGQRKNCHKGSHSAGVGSRAVQVVAEDIAESGTGA